MFKPIAFGALLLAAVDLSVTPISASEIGNTSYTDNANYIGNTSHGNFQAGQSFQAVDSNLNSIGFALSTYNNNQIYPDISYNVDLYKGNGKSSVPLATRSFIYSPPSLNNVSYTFYDVDFGGVSLNTGEQYTFFISSNSSLLTAALAGESNPYNLGTAYTYASYDTDARARFSQDLVFRVRGTNVVAVPGPVAGTGLASLLLLTGAALLRRRRAPFAVD